MALRIIGQAFLQQREATHHRHEQIVEVVSNLAGPLSDGIRLAGFKELRKHLFPLARALLDSRFELLVQPAQIGSPLEDSLFELGVAPFEITSLAIQVYEHPDLGAQQL